MHRTLRIGLVLPGTPAYSETFFRAKINGLIQAGHEVFLFAGGHTDDFDLCRVIRHPRVYQFWPMQTMAMLWRTGLLVLTHPAVALRFYRLERQSNRGFRLLLENLYLNSHILNQRLDWLHFGFATMGLRRENAAQAMGARMAVSLRGYDIAIYPLKHPDCYQLLWERVDKVHTISEALVLGAYSHGLSINVPVRKITPAINLELFSRKKPLTTNFQRPLRLLTVARLTWVKGLEYTLQALALLNRKGIDFSYTLIGTGVEYERLVFATHQLGIRDKLDFAGRKSPAEVQAAMEDADIYLQYSVSEGFCNAVLEAQAMGLLCIVSDAEGLPENVLHEQTGWVAPKRQPERLAEIFKEVLQTPAEKLGSIRTNAMARVKSEFGIQQQIEAFTAFYQS